MANGSSSASSNSSSSSSRKKSEVETETELEDQPSPIHQKNRRRNHGGCYDAAPGYGYWYCTACCCKVDVDRPAMEAVLRDEVLPRLSVRMFYRMRAVSSIFRDTPLHLRALSSNSIPSLSQESWLLLLRDNRKLLDSRPSSEPTASRSGAFPWDFQAFSDYDRRWFTPPGLTGPWVKDLIGTWGNCSYIGKGTIPCISSAANGLLCAYVRPPPLKRPRILVFSCLTASAELLDPPLPYGIESPFPITVDTILLNVKIMTAAAPVPSTSHAREVGSAAPAVGAYYILLLRPSRQELSFVEASECYCEDWSMQLYDSSLGHWKVPQSLFSATDDSRSLMACDFFFLSLDRDPDRDGLPRYFACVGHILGYHASADRWFKTSLTDSDIKAHFPHPHFNDFDTAFVKRDGRLLMLLWRGVAPVKVLEVSPISHRCSNLQLISVMPKRLKQRGNVAVTASSNLFCISFVPSCSGASRSSRYRTVVYDISKRRWYALPLPEDGCDYRCFAAVEPRETMRLAQLEDLGSNDDVICSK